MQQLLKCEIEKKNIKKLKDYLIEYNFNFETLHEFFLKKFTKKTCL